jgi:hypothetical protein
LIRPLPYLRAGPTIALPNMNHDDRRLPGYLRAAFPLLPVPALNIRADGSPDADGFGELRNLDLCST